MNRKLFRPTLTEVKEPIHTSRTHLAGPQPHKKPAPPEQTHADVLRDVRAAIADALGEDGEFPTTVEPEETCVRNPRSSLRVPDDHPLVRLLARAHETVTRSPARLDFHPAWPDTPIFNELGIPAVTYGPGSMECYWDDESVAVEEYLTAVKTYCVAALDIAG